MLDFVSGSGQRQRFVWCSIGEGSFEDEEEQDKLTRGSLNGESKWEIWSDGLPSESFVPLVLCYSERIGASAELRAGSDGSGEFP